MIPSTRWRSRIAGLTGRTPARKRSAAASGSKNTCATPVCRTDMAEDRPFWRTKALAEMSKAEWESLCDGCGRCCLVKIEDEDTGRIHFTDLACKLFDTGRCRCTDYENRTARVVFCVTATP